MRVDFVDEIGDSWQEFAVIHPKLIDYLEINKIREDLVKTYYESSTKEEQHNLVEEITKFISENETPWSGSEAPNIDWTKRVEIQGIIQKYITHSISSTINLPEKVSVEEVSKIYLESWKKGLKGITVYRDGSRSGVLITKSEPKSEFNHNDAPKRPKSLPAEAYITKSKGEDYTVIIGLLEDKPYEIFAYKGKGFSGHGELLKAKKGEYFFVQGELVSKITDNLTDEQEAITRGYSGWLRHGGNSKYVVEQLNKSKGSLVDFTKSLARVLKKYIPEGENSTLSCENCGGELIFQEGCLQCKSCGNSKCG